VLQARFGSFPDTLNFVLDTGSGGISLDSMTAEYFRLTRHAHRPHDPRHRRPAKGQLSAITRRSHLPSLTIDSLNFHVADYSRSFTAVYGERIDGIIGYSVLSRYIIKINYDSSRTWNSGQRAR
jgi:hypothetical protein